MLRCRTLGGLELGGSTAGEHTAVLSQPKRVALLVYLAVANPRRFLRRDTLLAMFWPELDQERARAALRQALTFLRHELGEEVIRSRGAEEVGIDPEHFWCDAVAFEEAVRVGDLDRALEVYQGHFLTGFHVTECGEFERWLDEQRRQLGDRAAEAASQLVDRAEATESLGDAARLTRRVLELRPDNERALRKLIVFLDRAGDRGRAVHEYEAFAGRLAAEYHTEPSPETKAILAEILARQATPAEAVARANQTRAAADLVPVVTGKRRAWSVAALIALVVLVGAGWWAAGRDRGAGVPATGRNLPRLAVLPFENLGAAEDEYFADGITDEIMTKLAGLSGLAVISSQSVMRYKGTTKTTGEIGRELGVQYLLQGRVRWQQTPGGSRQVRVTPRLIQVADDRQLWASGVDDLLEDVFRVQGQVAMQVANALGVTLLSREQEAVARLPTQHVGAYEQYLKGNALFRPGFCCGPELLQAVAAYESAVALDPGFAAAHAKLSMAHGGIRWAALDPARSNEHVGWQAEYAERAIGLGAQLPEAHLAMGWYYYMGDRTGRRDYRRALREFRTAVAAEPNNSSFIAAEGALYKRTGVFTAALERYARASDLDPLSRSPAGEAVLEHILLRRYDDGERFLERLAPIWGGTPSPLRAYLRLARDGDPAALRAWLDTTVGAAALPRFMANAAHGGGWGFYSGALVRTLCGECDAAIPLVPRNRRESDWQRYGAIAMLHEQAGRHGSARTYYDSATARLEDVGFSPPGSYDPPGAYAKLGRKDQAVRAARRQVQRARQQRDVFTETLSSQSLAEVYVMVGEYNAALEQLEWLLDHPSPISVPLLRADPLWDPLRNNPRFQALLAKHVNLPRE